MGFSDFMRGLGNDAPGETVATYLPLARSSEGKLHAAIPEVLRSVLRGLGDANDLQATPDSVNLALMAGLGGGAAAGPETAGTEMAHGVFAGRKARTANIPLADKALGKAEGAMSLVAPGEESAPLSSALDANEASLNSTGWFMGPDLQQRYEIPDTKQTLKLPWHKFPDTYEPISKQMNERLGRPYVEPDPGQQYVPWGSDYKLGDILDHKELFAAYPELKNIPVRPTPLVNFDSRGSYSPTNKYISLNTGDPESMNSVLHHEIQHAIQDIEGFTNGGNTAMWKTPEVQAFQKGVTDLKRTVHQTIEDRSALNPYTVRSTHAALQRGPDHIAFQEKYYPKEVAFLRGLPSHELNGLTELDKQEALSNKIDEELYNHYKNLAGETEARNVQTRLGEKPAGNDPPWKTQDVPYNKQGVWANNRLEDWNGNPVPDLRKKLNDMLMSLGGTDATR